MNKAEFDRYACSYNIELARSLATTGENREFYAQARVDWTAQCIAGLRFRVQRILDYGCGNGIHAPMLASKFRAEEVVGVDVSALAIEAARNFHAAPQVTFIEKNNWTPYENSDLAFANGVFHHISPTERQECLVAIRQALRRGGLFAFWENNPWNPGTNFVMSRCVFDENAIKISPREARGLLRKAGFELLRTDSLFYFPRKLKYFRVAERFLSWLPFGGQYQVLCRRTA